MALQLGVRAEYIALNFDQSRWKREYLKLVLKEKDFLYWRRKTKKKGERDIFKFIIPPYANQSLSLLCIALPFIWCC